VDIFALGAAFLAGLLTFLNPCVLPVLPIIFGAAAGTHKFGPVALSAGLALSFTAVGLFLATAGFSLGLSSDNFRIASAVLLIFFGAALAITKTQYALQSAFAPIGDWANGQMNRHQAAGLGGQFTLGVLLGALWSPCVGPTLGAATLLASQGQSLAAVTFAMLLFGVGASIPLLIIGMLLRKKFGAYRSLAGKAGQHGRIALGLAMIIAGALVLSGVDKRLESLFLDFAPDWLIRFSTQF
jgi:cytochrome c-type biogenesis protein